MEKRSIGSRELKTRLGTYLRQVQEGMTLIVTDRGRPVAELRPYEPHDGDLEDRLYELDALGVVSWEVRENEPLPAFRPIISRGKSASEAVLEDREDRF
ncbi:MAG TPA: type II toxin-antitoxin system prevent-host-death family antitoxin [Thermoanaerobaculia bacterium]|nr:type II toxin-antitoxin system prevent-host-death family antitoxin [Thermoanaerobaculia bacterium]